MPHDDDSAAPSYAVAHAWQQFQETILPAVTDDVPPATLGLLQLTYYFGARAALDQVGTIIDAARSQGGVEIALDALSEEIDGFLEAEGDLN